MAYQRTDTGAGLRGNDLRLMVNPEILSAVQRYAEQFASAQPFKHVVIDNFLRPAIAESLLAEFPSVSDPSKLVNEFGSPNPKSAISKVRELGGIYRDMDQLIQTPDFLALLGDIVSIPELRYDPWYFGAGTHENFHGAGLDAHYDFNIHPKTSQHRRINAIIYLNRDWDPSWGGSIRFHSNPWDLENDATSDVEPVFNRCVIFETTENSWHSVPPVNLPPHLRDKSRKSFTIYLYTDTRPTHETAPSHGTVYVQEGLPKHIVAGHTLTHEDVEALSLNIKRRHEYLRQMYKREYKFSEIIERQRDHIGTLTKGSHVPLLGYGKVGEVTEPIHADRWIGHSARFTVKPLKQVTGVVLHGWRPDDFPRIEVTLSIRGEEAAGTYNGGTFSLPLTLRSAISDEFVVDITTIGASRPPGGMDERELSLIADSIELIH